jgi:hypothetical protein
MVEFSKREDLERWLEDKPREWAVVLAARAALRAAPTLSTVFDLIDVGGGNIILPTFRGMAASWVASGWIAHSADLYAVEAADAVRAATSYAMGIQAAYATTQATSFATEIAYASGLDVAYAAASATEHVVKAASSANVPNDDVRKADHRGNEVWAAVSADATALEAKSGFNVRPSDLAIQGLWPTGTPAWAIENWSTLKRRLLKADKGWEVWIDWYEARVEGGPAMAALEVARVQIAREVWRRDPRVVNAHIKRLIEEYEKLQLEEREVFEHAVAGGSLKDNSLPTIPKQRRAAVEPIWNKGRLTLPKKPAKLDLDKRKFTAALTALRSEFRELAADVAAEANIDKRPAAFLGRLAERIPKKSPAQDELFRLGHAEKVFTGYAKTIDEEWPDFLVARYHALLLQFDRTLRQSPLWREFKQNAAKETLSAEQISDSTALAKEAADALRRDEAAEFVDQTIPNSLEKLAEALSIPADGDDASVSIIGEGSELLAADLIESVNNVLKAIAEVALTSARAYSKGFGKGFKAAAKKQGPKDGAKAFKWLRRIAVGTVGGGTAGTGAFIALSGLIAKYPDAFAWLWQVVKFLR